MVLFEMQLKVIHKITCFQWRAFIQNPFPSSDKDHLEAQQKHICPTIRRLRVQISTMPSPSMVRSPREQNWLCSMWEGWQCSLSSLSIIATVWESWPEDMQKRADSSFLCFLCCSVMWHEQQFEKLHVSQRKHTFNLTPLRLTALVW